MEAPKSQERLNENIALVRDLLEKQRLVEAFVHQSHDARKHELVESLVHRQHVTELQTKVGRLHTADIAHILDVLPREDRLLIWKLMSAARGGDILLEVSDGVRKQLVDAMNPDELLAVLQQMDGEDIAYIADDLPEAALHARLESLPHEDQHWLRSALTYDEDSVGHLMSNEMVVVRDSDTLEQAAQHLRGLHELPIHNDKLFVVDRRGLLVGVLPLQNMLLNEPTKQVGEVMAKEVVKFTPEDDASEVSKAFERYDLVSAPVINTRGKLVGRLTVDVVMDYLREETTEDVLGMAGLQGEEDLFAPIWNSARNRGLWLVVNLFTAFIASRVIGAFEGTIEQLVALAALMPIVASVGGNTGNQTTALIIRGISMGQITPENIPYLIRKELGISFVNGLVLGTAVGAFALALYQNLLLSLVIAVSMLLTLMLAALVGLAVPIVLERTGRDPALGSSVILTAATDSLGFFIFLGLATVFLMH